ncbi:MAG: MMPL family transporter [Pirellulaceae bacterium]
MSTKEVKGHQRRTFYQRWSVSIVVATLAFLPFSFYYAGRAVLSNVNRVEDWLPRSFEETQHLAWFRQHFASDQFVVVSWQGCQLGADESGAQDDPRLAILANLLVPQDSEFSSDEGSSTASILPESDQVARRKYFKSVITGRQMLDRLTNPPLSLPVKTAIGRLQGSMIGPDGRQTCLVVTLHNEALGEFKQVLGSGQRRTLRDNVPPGILRKFIAQAGIHDADIHLGGPPVDNSAIDEEGEKTLIRLAGLSGMLGLGLAWWSLRSIPLTIIVFTCGVLSAATSLATVALTGKSLDAILMSMPSLVYVLAISGAVHLVNYYREAIETGGLYASAERAVQHAWKPAALCSITTAVGLISLSVSELVPIRKFGIYSAAGVMSLVVIVYFFLPAALHLSCIGKRWLPRNGPAQAGSLPRKLETKSSVRVWAWGATFIVRRYRLVGSLCCFVTLLVGYGLRNTDSSIDLLKLFDHRARILQDYRWLEANLGKLVPLEIVVRFPHATLRESEKATSEYDWNALSFVQRLETVTRMQSLIDREFGPEGKDLVGRSLSAASFAPSLPSATTGNVGFIHRKAINARLNKSRQELSEAGFLSVDEADGSELWRISLRVAAFRNVDYGRFVRELEITQPLLDAYQTRSDVLDELTLLTLEKSPVGKRVLLWSNYEPAKTEKRTHETFEHVLHRLLEEYRCDVKLLTDNPRTTPLSELESLDQYDAVVVYGDFSDADLDVVRAGSY